MHYIVIVALLAGVALGTCTARPEAAAKCERTTGDTFWTRKKEQIPCPAPAASEVKR